MQGGSIAHRYATFVGINSVELWSQTPIQEAGKGHPKIYNQKFNDQIIFSKNSPIL